ncbi:hypothetical protein CDD82_6641 [Ophiocordyceps australis]|uniref:Zn(2)-C6 fungal-type domain-containing protein n=1 Tax=Ophiocordyceps australis TaxID=1399860 RepID=A0A2C5ZQV9_9HYPO|nr:hypothetical protein CDD82_6641 [Ophiocordyceps australis]
MHATALGDATPDTAPDQHPCSAMSPSPAPAGDASAVKLTRGTSCLLCQQRKVRCDKSKPCANCIKAGVECKVLPPAPPRRRKRRLQERDLLDRLRRYESLLNQHGIKFDAIGHSLKTSGPNDIEDLETHLEGLKTTPEADSSPLSAAAQEERGRSSWFPLQKEFRASEQLLNDSSEDDVQGPFIHRAFDKMFSNQDGFPFMVGSRVASVSDAHPCTIHILQLWQIYLDNINPLLKITHVPTIQAQIIDATSRLHEAPAKIEALMFAIYVIALTSLDESEVQKRFGEAKMELLGRYFEALQQALLNSGFMRNNDFICLQAYVLYLFAVRWFVDPRQVFCLTGIAVRIAQRLGLHCDPGGFGLAPFEVEQRRRLWWTIVGYDRRLGEMTGSTVTALSSGGDCKIPLNVNDSDLHVDGKEMPMPHSGPTEMLFALTRIEVAMAVASNGNRDSLKVNKTGQDERPTIRIAGQQSPSYTLDGFCAHMESTYLSQCDAKIPLHFFTQTMTRQNLCKMRIIAFLVRIHNAEPLPLDQAERDSHFLQATQMIEYDNVVMSAESLRSFRWYAMHYFPFPAYILLVQELRNHSSGPLVERAWEAITLNYNLRGLLNNIHSPMHTAFGGLFIRAWDAHQAAQQAMDKQTTTPPFITTLRERAERRRRAHAENRQDPGLEQAPVDFPRSRASPTGAATMIPAPLNQAIAGPGPPPPMAPAADDLVQETGEMDWSNLVSGYQDMGAFSGFHGIGSFAGPMTNVAGLGLMGEFGSSSSGMASFNGMGGPARGSMFGTGQ